MFLYCIEYAKISNRLGWYTTLLALSFHPLYNCTMHKIKGIDTTTIFTSLFAVAFNWWGQPQQNSLF